MKAGGCCRAMNFSLSHLALFHAVNCSRSTASGMQAKHLCWQHFASRSFAQLGSPVREPCVFCRSSPKSCIRAPGPVWSYSSERLQCNNAAQPFTHTPARSRRGRDCSSTLYLPRAAESGKRVC